MSAWFVGWIILVVVTSLKWVFLTRIDWEHRHLKICYARILVEVVVVNWQFLSVYSLVLISFLNKTGKKKSSAFTTQSKTEGLNDWGNEQTLTWEAHTHILYSNLDPPPPLKSLLLVLYPRLHVSLGFLSLLFSSDGYLFKIILKEILLKRFTE